MVSDLRSHELEVIRAFFARTMTWVATESASERAALAKLDDPDNDTIESSVNHPHHAYSLDQIAIRTVINELNSLCEFALQETWISLSRLYSLPKGGLVYTASRGIIEKALAERGTKVVCCPQWKDVLKIKEMSEGFKHRQRMQPFPVELQAPGYQTRATRAVDPNNPQIFTEYELNSDETSRLINAVNEFMRWLESKSTL